MSAVIEEREGEKQKKTPILKNKALICVLHRYLCYYGAVTCVLQEREAAASQGVAGLPFPSCLYKAFPGLWSLN